MSNGGVKFSNIEFYYKQLDCRVSGGLMVRVMPCRLMHDALWNTLERVDYVSVCCAYDKSTELAEFGNKVSQFAKKGRAAEI